MKLTFNSPVVLTFSFVCAIAFLLTSQDIAKNWFVLLNSWDTGNFGWYVRLFTHTVGHANANHLMGNMAIFLLIGPIVEERYGSKNLLIMILTTALATAFIQLIFFKEGLLGASGVVFMLILLVSLVNFKNKEIPLTFILIVIIYLGKEIWGSVDGEQDGISHSTHLVGGLVGAVFGFTLAGKKAKASEPPKDSVL